LGKVAKRECAEFLLKAMHTQEVEIKRESSFVRVVPYERNGKHECLGYSLPVAAENPGWL